jgi:hypothetical protein
MREIEKANPLTLYGVFGDAQWSNKERLSDALLKDLIEHFSRLSLGNRDVDSDLLAACRTFPANAIIIVPETDRGRDEFPAD